MNLFSTQIPVNRCTPANVKSDKAICLPDFVFMKKEIWKDIPSLQGLYQASNIGRIKRLPKTIKNHHAVWFQPERVLKLSEINGYLMVKIINGKSKIAGKVHRLVAEAFIQNPENKPQINHKNGIKNDNQVENLEWCTQKENNIHSYATGLRGSIKNKTFCVTASQIFEIKDKYKTGKYSLRKLSIEYAVCKRSIYNIINRQIS